MENKINIAELLKDCPKGMELDCTMFENPVKLDAILDSSECALPITVTTTNGHIPAFTKYGQYFKLKDAKCVIFPKGKTTWEGFHRPFKDGDILANGDTIFIYNSVEDNLGYGTYVIIDIYGAFAVNLPTKKYGTRFATEEEKQKLFDAIKANGHRWNAETKTLEKLIEPKFKVGDIVRPKNGRIPEKIISIQEDYYEVKYELNGKTWTNMLYFSNQNNYELVPNKFDITTLKPFDKVLVGDGAGFWRPSLFGKDMIVGYRYFTASGCYKKCIPYENNEHLLGTRNDCDDFYKTWET